MTYERHRIGLQEKYSFEITLDISEDQTHQLRKSLSVEKIMEKTEHFGRKIGFDLDG